MQIEAFKKALGELTLTKEELERFEAFEAGLYEFNEVMNLTKVPREECWLRHFVDSLLFQDLIPYGSSVLDIGTGPGFPAWPLACARPDLIVTALDSSNKMLGFLRSQPLPNLIIVQGRAEEWDVREAFDVVTGRALAPLPIQLELSAAPCKVDGKVILMRTPADDLLSANFEILGLRPAGLHKRTLPGTDIVRAFPVYVKERSTSARFPRKWAEIKAKPLVKA